MVREGSGVARMLDLKPYGICDESWRRSALCGRDTLGWNNKTHGFRAKDSASQAKWFVELRIIVTNCPDTELLTHARLGV